MDPNPLLLCDPNEEAAARRHIAWLCEKGYLPNVYNASAADWLAIYIAYWNTEPWETGKRVLLQAALRNRYGLSNSLFNYPSTEQRRLANVKVLTEFLQLLTTPAEENPFS